MSEYVMPEHVHREVRRILDGVARRFLDEFFDLLEQQSRGPLTPEQTERLEFLRKHWDGHTMWVRL